MQPNQWTIRLSDILDAIARIQRYIGEMSFDDFSVDEKTVDAVVRNFEIIGEAARNVPDSVQYRHPEIPWAEMIGMRNILIHQYAEVSLATVWKTVEHDLLPIVPALRLIQTEANQLEQYDPE